MRHFEHVITIEAPVERVWAKLSDLERWSDWNTVVPVRPEQLLQVGKRFPLRLRVGGRPLQVSATLVRVAPRNALVWKGGVRGLFTAEHGFELASDGSHTQLWHFEVFRGVLGAPVLGLLGSDQRQVYRRVNEAFAALL